MNTVVKTLQWFKLQVYSPQSPLGFIKPRLHYKRYFQRRSVCSLVAVDIPCSTVGDLGWRRVNLSL